MTQKMTLERLAIMVQNGFISLREELVGKIDAMGLEIAGIKERLKAIEAKLDEHDLKFDHLFKELRSIKEELAGNAFHAADLERRVARLEKKVGLA